MEHTELDDMELAAALAAGTAHVLRALRQEADDGAFRGDPRGLRAAGDARAQAFLAEALRGARRGDSVLSEEADDDLARLRADRVWIIDPLDGTREFGDHTDDGRWRDDFAVHVALWTRDQGLCLGAVALPARGRLYQSDDVAPNRDPAQAILTGSRPLRLVVSRTRRPMIVEHLAERDDIQILTMGSVGVKVAAVVDGVADAYIHAGGMHEWDAAAPVALAIGAGMVASTRLGDALVFNQANPTCPDLLVCHPSIVEHVRRLVAAPGDRSE